MATSKEKLKQLIAIKRNPQVAVLQAIQDMQEATRKELASMKESNAEIIKQTVKEIKDESIFSDLEPAKTLAKEVAEETIKDFKTDTTEKVDSVLATVETTREEVLGETKADIKVEVDDFKENKKTILSNLKDELATMVVSSNKSFAGILKRIENLRGPKGDKGDTGRDGIDGVTPKTPKDGKDGSPDTGKQIVGKLVSLEEADKLPQSAVKGLSELLQKFSIRITNAKAGRGGGGGMGNVQFKTFSGDGSTTSFTLDSKVASDGNAIIFIYQGQMLENGTHFTVSGDVISTTFTPDDGTTLFAWHMRT